MTVSPSRSVHRSRDVLEQEVYPRLGDSDIGGGRLRPFTGKGREDFLECLEQTVSKLDLRRPDAAMLQRSIIFAAALAGAAALHMSIGDGERKRCFYLDGVATPATH